MKNNSCLLLIHHDADLIDLERHAREMATPDVRRVYVRISKRMPILRRAKIMRRLRKIFRGVRFFVSPATAYQINLVHIFHAWVSVNHFDENKR